MTISFHDPAGLAKTLDSVRTQDHDSIQHVVIDGGSGPPVIELLGQTTHLHYWRSQPDAGRYDAMNIGVGHATGDIVWFLHSGDIFHSADTVSAVVTATAAMPPPLWGHGAAALVGSDGVRRGVMGRRRSTLRRFALGGRALPHQAAFFHRTLIDEIGLYSVDHGLAADQEFMLRAWLIRPPVVIDRILCDFDTAGAGSTRGVHPHFADMRRAVVKNLGLTGSQRVWYTAGSLVIEMRAYVAYGRRRIGLRRVR